MHLQNNTTKTVMFTLQIYDVNTQRKRQRACAADFCITYASGRWRSGWRRRPRACLV